MYLSFQVGARYHSTCCPAEANPSEVHLWETSQQSISTNPWETFSHWATWLAITALLGAGYIQHTVIWLCCLWRWSTWTEKEVIKHLTVESEVVTERKEAGPQLCSHSLYSACSQPVHHSLKMYSLHHWTVNLCCTNCYNTTYNNIKFP